MIRGSTEQAAGLARQLLAFSRKRAVEVTVLRFPELVATIQKMSALLGEGSEIVLTTEPDTGPIWADPMQL